MTAARDHGGGIDAAIARFGGARADWIDLSTGINPVPYPLPGFPADCWTALPDRAAFAALERAARAFWNVPAGARALAAPGASALIARIPALLPQGRVRIDAPTYNEHAAAFESGGWTADHTRPKARVVVHPNNPTGTFWDGTDIDPDLGLLVIDESFCDIAPDRSLIRLAGQPGVIVLKSFGKFWGLAGMRLGFAFGDPALVSRLADHVGPWAVSGPALVTGAKALGDLAWAAQTRLRLAQDAARLDRLICGKGAQVVGGTDLFRLYDVGDAARWQDRLAERRVLGRVFPYSDRWLRLGLPHPGAWDRLEAVL
jgi:cobalamin biosynthetic protein CobC